MSWKPPLEPHPDCPGMLEQSKPNGLPHTPITRGMLCWTCRQLHFEDWVQLQFKKPVSNIDPRGLPGAMDGRGVRR